MGPTHYLSFGKSLLNAHQVLLDCVTSIIRVFHNLVNDPLSRLNNP
jgi:hypothetical protein